jgi:hypothetical protein
MAYQLIYRLYPAYLRKVILMIRRGHYILSHYRDQIEHLINIILSYIYYIKNNTQMYYISIPFQLPVGYDISPLKKVKIKI